jgi:hypothetical protein
MIKAIENIKQEIKVDYPCMKKHYSGNVVLFNKSNCGTLLMKGDSSSYKIGDYREDWIEINFEPIDYSITLSNEVSK